MSDSNRFGAHGTHSSRLLSLAMQSRVLCNARVRLEIWEATKGFDNAANVCEAMYFLDFPATLSPNMRPEGMIAKAKVVTTDKKNRTMPTMRVILPLLLLPSTVAM